MQLYITILLGNCQNKRHASIIFCSISYVFRRTERNRVRYSRLLTNELHMAIQNTVKPYEMDISPYPHTVTATLYTINGMVRTTTVTHIINTFLHERADCRVSDRPSPVLLSYPPIECTSADICRCVRTMTQMIFVVA